MRVDIKYRKHSDVDAPCIAVTEIMGEELLAIGKTWAEAKERLMAKVNTWVNASVPAPESVEVASKDEEMNTELLPWEDQFGKVAAQITGHRDIEAGKL